MESDIKSFILNPIKKGFSITEQFMPTQTLFRNNLTFYQELDQVIEKHIRYLKEVESMEEVKAKKSYLLIKRATDLFVGVFGLILLSPVFLVVALLIKLDSSGPIFFVQERVGKKGKPFKIYKFRTMVKNAEEKTGPIWATDNDPRLTFIGKKLRDTKIDEFPQLINLVKGDMSMVGPRPERACFVNEFAKRIPGYLHRLDVKPGITGIAQVRNGYDRDPVKLIRKLRFEITYIKKMCLRLDLKILIETFVRAIKGKL